MAKKVLYGSIIFDQAATEQKQFIALGIMWTLLAFWLAKVWSCWHLELNIKSSLPMAKKKLFENWLMCHRKTSLNFLQICLTVELINKSGFQLRMDKCGQQNMCCVMVWLMSNWRSCSSISNRQESVKSQHLHFCMNHWTIKEPSQKRLQKVVCYWIFWKGVMSGQLRKWTFE